MPKTIPQTESEKYNDLCAKLSSQEMEVVFSGESESVRIPFFKRTILSHEQIQRLLRILDSSYVYVVPVMGGNIIGKSNTMPSSAPYFQKNG